MNLLNKLKITLPYSYMKILKDSIGEAKTILDLGCEDGRLLEILSDGENWHVTGVDIYRENIEIAAKKEIYVKLIKGDVVKTANDLVRTKKKYDVVFCSQVIEHVSRKKGTELLNLVEKLAKKRIIFGTPRGFMIQPHSFLGDNPHQFHKSGWSERDFRERGYKIFGIGFEPIWSEEGLGRRKDFPSIFVAGILSYVFSPLVYYFPFLGSGILCIKIIKQ